MEFLKIVRLVRNGHSNIRINVSRKMNSSVRWSSSTVEKKEDEAAVYSISDDDYEIRMLEKEQQLEMKRNKSRLNPQHQNIIHHKVPYTKPMDDAHLTLQYKRRMFGRYGSQSKINPGTLWPNVNDIENTVEYERIAFPYTIHEMITKEKEKIEEENNKINERQQKILSNINKLAQWKKEVEDRAAKKLADLAKAKAKKDALIEEVRKHFGYRLDEKDEKFKEMLILKERAQKKKLKEERSKAKQERLIEEMMKK